MQLRQVKCSPCIPNEVDKKCSSLQHRYSNRQAHSFRIQNLCTHKYCDILPSTMPLFTQKLYTNFDPKLRPNTREIRWETRNGKQNKQSQFEWNWHERMSAIVSRAYIDTVLVSSSFVSLYLELNWRLFYPDRPLKPYAT